MWFNQGGENIKNPHDCCSKVFTWRQHFANKQLLSRLPENPPRWYSSISTTLKDTHCVESCQISLNLPFTFQISFMSRPLPARNQSNTYSDETVQTAWVTPQKRKRPVMDLCRRWGRFRRTLDNYISQNSIVDVVPSKMCAWQIWECF